ncbi:MAG: 3-aminobutyryl-CoA ammonia-lyase [Chloroflexota bacterium]|jgi:3-aminobutyryl-CoA ammonia-lyase|nr:3-aminobutyryl-CoA ammonia-lyase [Chloroflexota bacterium]
MVKIVDLQSLPADRVTAEMTEKVHEQWGGGPRGLVGGWWALKEVGWLASMVGIKLDGDTSLLAHYNVDFLSPIFAGDWVRIKGEVSRIGNTARTVDFEVERYIDGSHIVFDTLPEEQYGGGAVILDPPVPALRGQFVIVVPKSRQRKPLPWIDVPEDQVPPATFKYALPPLTPGVVDVSTLPDDRYKAEMVEKVHEEWGGGPRGFVGGWWVMKEVGWLLSEIAIRLDGDFGPLAHYDVDFTGPVFSADWVRLRGEIVRIGETSRTMDFVVEKVIDGSQVQFDSAADSEFGGGAEILEPAMEVARGRAVFVVAKERQRKPFA